MALRVRFALCYIYYMNKLLLISITAGSLFSSVVVAQDFLKKLIPSPYLWDASYGDVKIPSPAEMRRAQLQQEEINRITMVNNSMSRPRPLRIIHSNQDKLFYDSLKPKYNIQKIVPGEPGSSMIDMFKWYWPWNNSY